MNRLLFWKILFGFWLTTILIVQGVYLLLSFSAGPLETATDGPDLEHFALAIAAQAVHSGGLEALKAQTAGWPARMREELQVGGKGRSLAAPGRNSLIATAPNGASYNLTYRAQLRPYLRNPKFFLLSLIGGLSFSAILSWYLTAPLQRMRLAFDMLAKGDLNTRLGPMIGRRRDEIADLARAFDIMAARLDELARARDRLLADVSHELRSPLARLQLAIGLARQDSSNVASSLERISREAARLDDMVGELLVLSRLESGVAQDGQYFDVAEIVESVAQDALFEAGPAGVDVCNDIGEIALGANWIVKGNGKVVARALENIVRNALRYSRQGQSVKIALWNLGTELQLSVTDQGPGVPDAMLTELFKPFVRGQSESAKGFGLGLAIAERAIIAHGGKITARNGIAGGLIVTIHLPISETQVQLHEHA